MNLFSESDNTKMHDMCGNTSLLNVLSWVNSSAWDGRYAIVVVADIAVYSWPTCVCGAVAMLVGRDTPLQFDMKSRTTYAADVWDFFKPEMDSE